MCGSKEITSIIETELVMPIDAKDCGVDISVSKIDDISSVAIQRYINRLRPYNGEKNRTIDQAFIEAVAFAKNFIERDVAHIRSDIDAREQVLYEYKQSEYKQILVLKENIPWESTVMGLEDVLFVVYPHEKTWRIKCARDSWSSFKARKKLPRSWWGKRKEELNSLVGITDATFCHPNGFTGGADSMSSVVKMAELALKD